MRIRSMLPGGACLALAVFIFLFAEDNRRIYSGVFFTILGIALLANARRRNARDTDE